MVFVMILLCLFLFTLLVAVASIIPQRTDLSLFELQRRAKAGDIKATKLIQREGMLNDVLSLQRVLQAVLLVLFVTASVAAFGWFLGVLVSVVVALEYGAFTRMNIIRNTAQSYYEKYEETIIAFIQRHSTMLHFFKSTTTQPNTVKRLDSREELEHMVDQSSGLLSSDEKKLIVHSLQFDSRRVEEIMTPKGMIDSVPAGEMLGPLVLDDLHKTGHSRFPVVDGDVDHVVGMLYIQDLLTLNSKATTTTASKTMDPRVFYIKKDQTLQHALAAFLRTRHHLFIVVNEFRETVGLLSLEDVIEALLGHKIIDEFDAHDDLRTVAARNPRANNRPGKREDV